jgi:hypothetical protein
MKVLTHRPRYIEPAAILEFGEGASSTAKTKETVPPVQRIEDPATKPKLPSAELDETKAGKGKTEESNIEEIKVPEILSPSLEVTVPKAQKSSATTPKRRRMTNVLDVVLETAKTLSSTPSRKFAEASKAQPEAETKQTEVEAETQQAEVEAVVIQSETKAGSLEPTETEPAVVEEKGTEQVAPEKFEAPASEASK